jgi:hypothetical protein
MIMKVLLHTCCADCALKIIATVGNNVTLFYYNPNIHPRAEYQSRLAAVKKIALENKIKLIVPDWKPDEYFERVKNDGDRCKNCWYLRIIKTAEYAKENGFEQFSTTLLSSKYQNRITIEKMAKEIGGEGGVEFLKIENINREMKTSGFYKQFFCGCCYSLTERFEEKYGKTK